MPLSWLRRPLVVLTLLYIALLFLLRALGCFKSEPPPNLLRYRFFPSVRIEGRVLSPVKEDQRGEKVFIQGEKIENEAFPQKVLVFLPRQSPSGFLRPGQTVRFSGRLRLPRAARNPGDFDEKAWLFESGAAWILQASAVEALPLPIAWLDRPRYAAEAARLSMRGRFRRLLPEEEANVLMAVTLGHKAPLRPELKRAIQDAGAMHLLVASGSNVILVTAAAAWLGLLLCLGPPARFLCAAAAGGFYTLMTGADAPGVRAYCGVLVFLGAPLLERDPGSFQAAALSALVILLREPRELFSAGFQMSFLAVLGIVLVMPRFPWWNKAIEILAVSALIQIMLWPIFAQVFGRASLVGILSNIILVPFSGLLMASGFILWAAPPTAPCVEWMVGLFTGVCEFFAGLPGAAVALSPMNGWSVASYYLSIFALLALPRKRVSLGLAAGALTLYSAGGLERVLRAPDLRVVMLSLPKARTALLTFRGERHWLVDPGGPSSAVLNALKAYRVERLEKVIVTGEFEKEKKALFRLLQRVPVEKIERTGAGKLLRICSGEVCFEFGAPEGPRAFKGEAQYSVVALRLRRGALETSTDGAGLRILSCGE